MKRRSFLTALGLAGPLATALRMTAVVEEPLVVVTTTEAKTVGPALEGEVSTLSNLEEAVTRGIPIPLRVWCAAAGVNRDQLMADLQSAL